MLAAAAPYAGDDVAVRLAEALADLEPRVMLIDADLRHESSGAGAELAESGGLTAILCDQSTLEDEIVLASYGQDGDDPLPARAWELLPAGTGASRPTALLGSPEMEALLARARDRADIVIVAAPSLASGADALVLAPLCDDIVVVVRERSATRDQARGARRVLAATSTPVVGLIFEQRHPGSLVARAAPAPAAGHPAPPLGLARRAESGLRGKGVTGRRVQQALLTPRRVGRRRSLAARRPRAGRPAQPTCGPSWWIRSSTGAGSRSWPRRPEPVSSTTAPGWRS